MKTYILKFTGRSVVAIGLFQKFSIKLEATSEEDAVNKLYEKYEHVSGLVVKEDRPEEDKVYALTGVSGASCIANGNTWEESEVKK